MTSKAKPPSCGNCAHGLFRRSVAYWVAAPVGKCGNGSNAAIKQTDAACDKWAKKFPGRPKGQ
jgi:hypothetical protein